MNILEEANKIVNTKTERSVLYGSYRECNQRIADIMSILSNKEITVTDVFYLEVAMKFAREIQVAFESFRKTELNKPFYNYKDDNSMEFNFYF